MVRSLADECCPSPNRIVAEGMSGSRTRTGRRVQGDMGEVTTQGYNATESMNQARLPRQVYDPNTEPDRPCLLARTLWRFSPRKRMEVARSCTFCTPARSDESRPELVLPLVLHSSNPRLPNGRKSWTHCRQPFPRGHNGRFARNPNTCSRLRGCGQLQGLPSFLHKKSQVGQPPIMPTLFESRKPKTCRIEKQEYHNPDRIHRPQREPVVNRKKFARASHRGRRNQQE
jgi:hypothetical protein